MADPEGVSTQAGLPTTSAGPPTKRAAWTARLAWAAAGLLWVFWLGFEDRGLGLVLAVSAAVCLAAVLSVGPRWPDAGGSRWRGRVRGGVLGFIGGMTVAPLAVVLMTIKVSLHSHPIPDFNAADVRAVLGRIPAWCLAGMLAGVGVELLARRHG